MLLKKGMCLSLFASLLPFGLVPAPQPAAVASHNFISAIPDGPEPPPPPPRSVAVIGLPSHGIKILVADGPEPPPPPPTVKEIPFTTSVA